VAERLRFAEQFAGRAEEADARRAAVGDGAAVVVHRRGQSWAGELLATVVGGPEEVDVLARPARHFDDVPGAVGEDRQLVAGRQRQRALADVLVQAGAVLEERAEQAFGSLRRVDDRRVEAGVVFAFAGAPRQAAVVVPARFEFVRAHLPDFFRLGRVGDVRDPRFVDQHLGTEAEADRDRLAGLGGFAGLGHRSASTGGEQGHGGDQDENGPAHQGPASLAAARTRVNPRWP
jgi:hypothetical protein